MTEEIFKGELTENRIIIWDKSQANQIYDQGYYGKVIEDRNELALTEALFLVEKGKLIVVKDKKEVEKKKLMEIATADDKEFPWKYAVFKDLRNRGLLVKTGFKFGTHFRVYERGVHLKKGPKETREHTKWIVHAIAADYMCSLPELSRAVRLAHNIRARMLWAVVDEEQDITYYEVNRIKP